MDQKHNYQLEGLKLFYPLNFECMSCVCKVLKQLKLFIYHVPGSLLTRHNRPYSLLVRACKFIFSSAHTRALP